MKMTIKVSLIMFAILFSSGFSLFLKKSGFYPGSTNLQLQKTTEPLINKSNNNSNLLAECLKRSFESKYETAQRDLWSKISKVNQDLKLMYLRKFWEDFFLNINEEVIANEKKENCSQSLLNALKTDNDFKSTGLQNTIRDSLKDYAARVTKLVKDRSNLFVTSSITTHRYANFVNKDVFSNLNKMRLNP